MRIKRTIRALAAATALVTASTAGAQLFGKELGVVSQFTASCSKDAKGALTFKATWNATPPTNLAFGKWRVTSIAEGDKDVRQFPLPVDLPGNARSASQVVPAGTWPNQDRVTLCRMKITWTYAAPPSSIEVSAAAKVSGP